MSAQLTKRNCSPKTTLILTPKRQAILAFIKHFIESRQYPPTYEEIRAGCDLSSKSLVDYHLNILAEAKYIERDLFTPRGLRLGAALTGPTSGAAINLYR